MKILTCIKLLKKATYVHSFNHSKNRSCALQASLGGGNNKFHIWRAAAAFLFGSPLSLVSNLNALVLCIYIPCIFGSLYHTPNLNHYPAFSMTARGTDNLRNYLRQTKLPQMTNDAMAPKMPPPGHKSHQNHLSARSQAWRRLESIYSLTDISMPAIVMSCLCFLLINLGFS